MSRSISASHANQHFSRMLREVAEGASFTVTSHGRPVARLTPAASEIPGRSVLRFLDFAQTLPIRRAGDWTREDLYE